MGHHIYNKDIMRLKKTTLRENLLWKKDGRSRNKVAQAALKDFAAFDSHILMLSQKPLGHSQPFSLEAPASQ